MKKMFSFAVVAIVVLFAAVCFTSCGGNDKKSSSSATSESSEDLGDIMSQVELFDGYVVFQTNIVMPGEIVATLHAGLKKDGKVIIQPRFDNISYDAELEAFKCYSDANRYTVADKTGKVLREGAYERVSRDDDGTIYRFFDKDKMAIYSTKAQTSWGMYSKVVVTKHFVFVKEDNKWGIKSLDGKYEFDKVYDRAYVVNFKSETDFAVVVCKNGEWELCDQDGAFYSDTSEGELKRLIKFPLSEPVGELDYAKF